MIHGKHIIKSFDKDLIKINGNLISMSEILIEELQLIMDFFSNNNFEDLQNNINKKEEVINELNQKILNSSLKIFTLRSPVAWDLRYVFSVSHIARCFEKNGDNLKKLLKNIAGLASRDQDIDNKIINMLKENINIHRLILNIFTENHISLEKSSQIKDVVIDQEFSEMCNLVLQKIQREPEKLSSFYNYLFLGRRLEHIGDQIDSVKKFIGFIENGNFEK